MSALAIREPEASSKVPDRAPRVRIPKRISQAIDLIASGDVKYQKDAAERVGLTAEHLSRMLAKPHVRGVLHARATENLARGTLRASARMLELVDATSEHVSLDAATKVLAIAGIRPPDDGRGTTVNVGVSVGYVLDLRPGEQAPSHAAGAQHAVTLEHDTGGSVDNAR